MNNKLFATEITLEQEEDYPDHVLNGVMESIKQADEGLLMPYTSIKDLLNNPPLPDSLTE